MGRLTIDIPDNTQHHIKVMAARHGVTIREYVLERLRTDLSESGSVEPSLHDLAAAWKKRRTDFKLERGDKSWTEVFHEGHEW